MPHRCATWIPRTFSFTLANFKICQASSSAPNSWAQKRETRTPPVYWPDAILSKSSSDICWTSFEIEMHFRYICVCGWVVLFLNRKYFWKKIQKKKTKKEQFEDKFKVENDIFFILFQSRSLTKDFFDFRFSWR